MRRVLSWLAVASASFAVTDYALDRFAGAVADLRRPRVQVCTHGCAHGFVPEPFAYPAAS